MVNNHLAGFLAEYPIVVFDLDGVIVDSNELKVDCVRAAFDDFPKELVDEFDVEFRHTFGRSRREHFAAFHRTSVERGLADEDFDAFYAHYAGGYASLLAERYPQAPLCAHADRLISALSAPGILLYVATGTLTAEAVQVLERGGLLGSFYAVLGGEEPKAARLSEILARNGVDGSDVVLVGDSRQDVLAADEAGVDFLLATGYGLLPPEQVLCGRHGRGDRIVTDLDPNAPVRQWTTAGSRPAVNEAAGRSGHTGQQGRRGKT